jgi:DNA-binding transcriptional MerR regulator
MKLDAKDLIKYHCPRWEELPEIDLYVDQVVSILQKNLVIFAKDKEKENQIITSSMINNYVKKNILNPPIKKKYNKEHLAKLFVICICKKLMSISEIGEAIKNMEKNYSVEEGYNIFCEELEKALKHTFDYENKKIELPLEEEKRELATLKAITMAFANTILVDRLIMLRNNKKETITNK